MIFKICIEFKKHVFDDFHNCVCIFSTVLKIKINK
jgi:hypothetical protein